MEILNIKTKNGFYLWLKENHNKEKECFIVCKKGNPNNINNALSYIDAVYCALCFGWIDSTTNNINGNFVQRFSKRQKGSDWSELNKERVRYLVKTGEMTESGLKACPDLDKPYEIPSFIVEALKLFPEAYEFFITTPNLYQRFRAYNTAFYYDKDKKAYKVALENLIEKCKRKQMYGQWNDYGRLL